MNIFSFNQKRVLVVCILLGLIISPVNYLQAQEFAVDESVSASEEPNINEIIEDFLNSKGWYEGENTKKNGSTFFVAVGKEQLQRAGPNLVGLRQGNLLLIELCCRQNAKCCNSKNKNFDGIGKRISAIW